MSDELGAYWKPGTTDATQCLGTHLGSQELPGARVRWGDLYLQEPTLCLVP